MENRVMAFAAGAGLGAGLMYLLDAQGGRRRRARVRDRAASLWRDARVYGGKTARDVAHRASGLAAGVGSTFDGAEVTDRVLRERVRSKLGRVVSHPRAVAVTATGGRVTLAGPILTDEADRLVAAVRSVPGVRAIEDRLDRHAEPGNIPALQGGRTRPGEQWELLQKNWSPTTRLAIGLAGAGLVTYGLTRDAPWACVVGSLGLGLLATGAVGGEITELLPDVRAAIPPLPVAGGAL